MVRVLVGVWYDWAMNKVIYETQSLLLEVPERPFVSREEGGHIRIMSKIKVSDRTKLTKEQAIEYTRLSMIAGEALKAGLAKRGIEVGIVNYQEMGNWSVFKPEGPIMHMHIFGRAKSATIQKYGEAVQLPRRETGFYDGFMPLDEQDILEVESAIKRLAESPKYSAF